MLWKSKCAMDSLNSNKFFLVTGGSSGIGEAVFKKLNHLGYSTIITFKTNRHNAEKIAKSPNVKAIFLDLHEEHSIFEAVKTVEEIIGEKGSLEGVILCSSPPPIVKPFLNSSSEDLSYHFKATVIGNKILLSEIINRFFAKKRSGIILGVSSKAIGDERTKPEKDMLSYIVAKSAFTSMLNVCAAEFKWLKVRIVYPGYTKTNMLNSFDKRYLELLEIIKPFSTTSQISNLILEKILNV